mmetsp:Transcript_31503/g.62946  ORF Transcript_31503/g.62946 Transcript_31503/m.62946 type:complete len:206 (+) Transcript_31503:767-1384(+)
MCGRSAASCTSCVRWRRRSLQTRCLRSSCASATTRQPSCPTITVVRREISSLGCCARIRPCAHACMTSWTCRSSRPALSSFLTQRPSLLSFPTPSSASQLLDPTKALKVAALGLRRPRAARAQLRAAQVRLRRARGARRPPLAQVLVRQSARRAVGGRAEQGRRERQEVPAGQAQGHQNHKRRRAHSVLSARRKTRSGALPCESR